MSFLIGNHISALLNIQPMMWFSLFYSSVYLAESCISFNLYPILRAVDKSFKKKKKNSIKMLQFIVTRYYRIPAVGLYIITFYIISIVRSIELADVRLKCDYIGGLHFLTLFNFHCGGSLSSAGSQHCSPLYLMQMSAFLYPTPLIHYIYIS